MSLKTTVKKVLYTGGYYHIGALLNSAVNERLLIIMYHGLVDDDARRLDWTLRTEPGISQFRSQLKALKRCARLLTVAEAITEIQKFGRLKERSIAITFDDGLESNYRLGFPVLKELNVPATIFLPTDFISGRMKFWWSDLAVMLRRLDGKKASVEDIYACLELEAPAGIESLQSDDSRLALLCDLENRLRNLETHTAEARVARLADLPVDESVVSSPSARPMTWEQIREMSKWGVAFGAHTVSHPNMCYIDDVAAEREFRECRREIEQQIDKPVHGLAYPYGIDYTAYTRLGDLLRRCGFLYALTAIAGYNDHNTPPYLLRRVNLPMADSQSLIGRELLLDFQMDNQKALVPYLSQ